MCNQVFCCFQSISAKLANLSDVVFTLFFPIVVSVIREISEIYVAGNVSVDELPKRRPFICRYV